MPRQSKTKPVELTINSKVPSLTKTDGSPDPKSSPMNLEGIDLSSFGGDIGMDGVALPPLPQSPPIELFPGQHTRDASKAGVVGVKSRAISEPEIKESRTQIRQVKDDEEFRPSSSSVSKIYHLRKNPGSTPELSLVGSKENVQKQQVEGNVARGLQDARPQPSPQNSADNISVKRKEKGFRNPLSRSKSIRRDSDSKMKLNGKPVIEQPPKTAPISANWQGSSEALLKAKGKDKRGKSAERAMASESDDNVISDRRSTKDGRGFVSGSKNVMSKAVAGGGSFLNRLGKVGRSGSSTAKEVPDSEYVMRVITLPLIEQTRITRISKDLTKCRDKTEYWMPSLPWRCIDYLNQNCESEGLYRVPGSGPQIKHWQRRFDTELDINLLDEEELYDPNNIGSLLKSWLRTLPTDIMPKELQHELAEEIAQVNPEYQKIGQPTPQQLRDALSNLPPFNYYLLFAITCHLSLLLSHQDKNRMDLHNLFICIGPGLDMERWLFNYLVGDWRHCWQGCFTEKQYLEAERAYEQGSEYVVPSANASQTALYDDEDDDLDEERRAMRSRGQASSRSRATSAAGSRYEDARSVQHSPVRGSENARPDANQPPALPSKYVNGSSSNLTRPMDVGEQKRPATAGKSSENSSNVGTPTGKPAHQRSKSDYQLSPMKPSSPVDFPFSLRDT